MEELKINVTAEGNEVVIRTGEALPLQESVRYKAVGTIGSLCAYLKKRKHLLDQDLLVIEMNETRKSITVFKDPNDTFSDVVVGQLEENPNLSKFCINSSKKFSREELVKLIKFNRLFFAMDEFSSILVQLNDFTAKVQASLNQASDNRGNKSNSFSQKIEAEVSLGFKLSMPLFKGVAPKSFFVDIAFDISDGGVQFWLESVELAELQQAEIESVFSAFKDEFSEYVTIEQ